MALRDAGVRLPPLAGPLPADRHLRVAAEHHPAGRHLEHQEAENRPQELVHRGSGRLRLLPLQLHLSAHPMVDPRGPLALRPKVSNYLVHILYLSKSLLLESELKKNICLMPKINI